MITVYCYLMIFFFKQKTAYEMRISDWSSDVCSSDLRSPRSAQARGERQMRTYDHNVLAPELVKRLITGTDSEDNAMVLLESVILGVMLYYRPDEIGRASCRERVCQYV